MTPVISIKEKSREVRLEGMWGLKGTQQYHILVDGKLLPEPPKSNLIEGLERYHEVCSEVFPGYGVQGSDSEEIPSQNG